jgi:hypothetical protein
MLSMDHIGQIKLNRNRDVLQLGTNPSNVQRYENYPV